MARRRQKLKELHVRVPVLPSTRRTQEIDDLAFEEAQRISSTPIKRFKFLGAGGSPFMAGGRDFVYSALGTPKEE